MMLNSCLCRGALLLRHRTSASGLAKRLLGGEGGRGNAKGTAVRKIKIVPKKETGNEGGEAKPEVAKGDPRDNHLSDDDYSAFRLSKLAEAGLWSAAAPSVPKEGEGITTSYPEGFSRTHSLEPFRREFGHLSPGEAAGEHHGAPCSTRVAGRIHALRCHSKKLYFIDLLMGDGILQIVASANFFSGGNSSDNEADFESRFSALRRGDIVGVEGMPVRTKAGELSVRAREITVLAPCLRKLPRDKYRPDNVDKRFRKRYLDFIVNSDRRSVLWSRARAVSALRRLLSEEEGFLEVETPVLAAGAGGAFAAAPFRTFHNDFDRAMFLRVAPELHLKQLLVGGFEKVFEIGKSFRNEGVDSTHNPEFTTLEFYAAYMDFQGLMSLAARLLRAAAITAAPDLKVPCQMRVAGGGKRQIVVDFKSKFGRVDYFSALQFALGDSASSKLPTPAEVHADSLETRARLFALCHRQGIGDSVECESRSSSAKLVDRLFSRLVEPGLVQPTFVTGQPQAASPLARPAAAADKEAGGRSYVAQRFELYAAGCELANAYSELNDPALQAELFRRQRSQDGDGQESDSPSESDFVRALEYGMPPAAGFGLGVDRLAMLLSGQASIREAVAFPATRPPRSREEVEEEEEDDW